MGNEGLAFFFFFELFIDGVCNDIGKASHVRIVELNKSAADRL